MVAPFVRAAAAEIGPHAYVARHGGYFGDRSARAKLLDLLDRRPTRSERRRWMQLRRLLSNEAVEHIARLREDGGMEHALVAARLEEHRRALQRLGAGGGPEGPATATGLDGAVKRYGPHEWRWADTGGRDPRLDDLRPGGASGKADRRFEPAPIRPARVEIRRSTAEWIQRVSRPRRCDAGGDILR